MTNLEIVKSTYEGKTSEENGENLKAYLAPDAQWTEAAGFPYAGTYTGIQEISRNVFHRLATEWIDYKFTPENYITGDNQIAVIGTYTGTYKITMKPFAARVVHVWDLCDGKIVRFEQFVDSKKVVEAMN